MKALIIATLLMLACFGVLSAADDGGDITPPVFISATAPDLIADTILAAQTITLSVHMTDDLSGLDYLQIVFVNELGYNDHRECNVWVDGDGMTDIAVKCPVTFPRYSAEGKWLPASIFTNDRVGNRRSVTFTQCLVYRDSECQRYAYNEYATDAIRAMEIQIGAVDPNVDPPIYMPFVAR
jgi:hypothetical protein